MNRRELTDEDRRQRERKMSGGNEKGDSIEIEKMLYTCDFDLPVDSNTGRPLIPDESEMLSISEMVDYVNEIPLQKLAKDSRRWTERVAVARACDSEFSKECEIMDQTRPSFTEWRKRLPLKDDVDRESGK